MAPVSSLDIQDRVSSPSDGDSSLDVCHKKSKKVNPPVDLAEYQLLHQVLRHRAADPIQVPLLAFPKRGYADYEYFTGADLYRFADCAASIYEKQGLRTNDFRTVAILGYTNIDWVVSTFALSMAGYTVLTLSPRLSSEAIAKLLRETNCESLVYGHSTPIAQLVEETVAIIDVYTVEIHSRSEYDIPDWSLRNFAEDPEQEGRPAIIMHSSGSTGLPKSLYFPHARLVKEFPLPGEERDLITLPLFHTFALSLLPTRMYRRKTVHFLNSDLPVTREGLTQAIAAARPELLSTVPYILKLLAEENSGIESLRGCGHVLTTGSQCPDDLGDRLEELGVNVSTLYGSTECGLVAASTNRPKEDKAWNYLRLPESHMEHILPSPVGNDQYEFVFLKDYPDRVVANSEDPPDSFHSKDIFTRHSTIPSAWKYVTRVDDRVTLLNGEKVLPLPIEGRIRQHALVREVVVFGIGKAVPGILLFRTEDAEDLADTEFVDQVLPAIDEANRHAESFSQISRAMVVPLKASASIPYTDKGSVIRAQVYRGYEKEIESAYASLEDQPEGTALLDVPALVDYLLSLGQKILGKQIPTAYDDLFSLGMNSLQAIEMRGALFKHLNLGGNGKNLSQNVIFEQGNISDLAKHLNAIRLGKATGKEKPISLIEEMSEKYSVSPKQREKNIPAPEKNVVVLTGATGGLGAHLLAQLASHPQTSHIYCLLRGQDAVARLERSIKSHHSLTLPPLDKYTVLTSSLHEPHLGLSKDTYATLQARTTHIIHAAWPVNFQLGLPSFSSSLQGLHNLLALSLTAIGSDSRPARLLFCSSISVALDTPSPSLATVTVPEGPVSSSSHIQPTGYAASKLVGEKIVERANRTAGANASVVRIGQIVGDTETGVWNETEMVPLMIRSSLSMGVLPRLNGERCCWLPMDVCAKAMIEIEGLNRGEGVKGEKEEEGKKRLIYNVSSPLSFRWNEDLLPALKVWGLKFETVSFEEWIARLRSLASTPQTTATTANDNKGENRNGKVAQNGQSKPAVSDAADPAKNPALKLVDFFEESYGGRSQNQGAQRVEGEEKGSVVFATDEAEKASPSLRNAPDVIGSGLLGKMMGVWMEKWTTTVSRSTE